MSERFPAVGYQDVVKVTRKLGFYLYRQTKGSHEIWRRDSDGQQTTILKHGHKILKRKTFKSILKDFLISHQEFSRLRIGKEKR